MRIEEVLENLEELLRRWGISKKDWIFVAQYAYRLLGYDVKVRREHLNIIVNREKIPWEIGEGLEIHPHRGTKFSKQYNHFIRKTDFDFDITHLSPKDFKGKEGKFILYSLPNGKQIRVQTPIGAIEELERLLSMSIDEGWGVEKGARVLEFVEDQIQAFIKRGETKSAKLYKQLLEKYKHLKRARKIPKKISKVKTIRGIVASKGIVKGRVNVVLGPEKTRKFKEGEILVTTMTSPKFTIFLKKTAGIVTDEGGMLSHAAIVAREMGIPCVVGTRIATKVFKDGDLIGVEADPSTTLGTGQGKGIVRKLDK